MYTSLVLHSCRPYSRVYKSKIEQKFVNNCSGFFGLIYNFKLFSGSIRVRACIFGFVPYLVGPLTTLPQTSTGLAIDHE